MIKGRRKKRNKLLSIILSATLLVGMVPMDVLGSGFNVDQEGTTKTEGSEIEGTESSVATSDADPKVTPSAEPEQESPVPTESKEIPDSLSNGNQETQNIPPELSARDTSQFEYKINKMEFHKSEIPTGETGNLQFVISYSQVNQGDLPEAYILLTLEQGAEYLEKAGEMKNEAVESCEWTTTGGTTTIKITLKKDKMAGTSTELAMPVRFKNGVTPNGKNATISGQLYVKENDHFIATGEKLEDTTTAKSASNWGMLTKVTPALTVFPDHEDGEEFVFSEYMNGPTWTFAADNKSISTESGYENGALFTKKLQMTAVLAIPSYVYDPEDENEFELDDFDVTLKDASGADITAVPSMGIETTTLTNLTSSQSDNMYYVYGWNMQDSIQYKLYKFVWNIENQANDVDLRSMAATITLKRGAVKVEDARIFVDSNGSNSNTGFGIPMISNFFVETADFGDEDSFKQVGTVDKRVTDENYALSRIYSRTYTNNQTYREDIDIPFSKNVEGDKAFDVDGNGRPFFNLKDIKNPLLETDDYKRESLKNFYFIDGIASESEDDIWNALDLNRLETGNYAIVDGNGSYDRGMMSYYRDMKVKVYITTDPDPYVASDSEWQLVLVHNLFVPRTDGSGLYAINDGKSLTGALEFQILGSDGTPTGSKVGVKDIKGVKFSYGTDQGVVPAGFQVLSPPKIRFQKHISGEKTIKAQTYINHSELHFTRFECDDAAMNKDYIEKADASVYYYDDTNYLVDGEKTVINNTNGKLFYPGDNLDYTITINNTTQNSKELPVNDINIIDTPEDILVKLGSFGAVLNAQYKILDPNGKEVSGQGGNIEGEQIQEDGVYRYVFKFSESDYKLEENYKLQIKYSITLPTVEQIDTYNEGRPLDEQIPHAFSANNSFEIDGGDEGKIINISNKYEVEINVDGSMPHIGVDKKALSGTIGYHEGDTVDFKLTLNHYAGDISQGNSYVVAKDVVPTGFDFSESGLSLSSPEQFAGEKFEKVLDSMRVIYYSHDGSSKELTLANPNVEWPYEDEEGFSNAIKDDADHYYLACVMENGLRTFNYAFSKNLFEPGDRIEIDYQLVIGTSDSSEKGTSGGKNHITYITSSIPPQAQLENTVYLFVDSEFNYSLPDDGAGVVQGVNYYLPIAVSYNNKKDIGDNAILNDSAKITVYKISSKVSLRKTVEDIVEDNGYYYFQYRVTLTNLAKDTDPERGAFRIWYEDSSTLYDRLPVNHSMAGTSSDTLAERTKYYMKSIFTTAAGTEYEKFDGSNPVTLKNDDSWFQEKGGDSSSYGPLYQLDLHSFADRGFAEDNRNQTSYAAILYAGESYAVEYWSKVPVGDVAEEDQGVNSVGFYSVIGIDSTAGEAGQGYGYLTDPESDKYFFGNSFATSDTENTGDDMNYLKAQVAVSYNKDTVAPDIQKIRASVTGDTVGIDPISTMYTPGDVVYWRVEVETKSTSDLELEGGYKVIDVLPPQLDFVEASLLDSAGSTVGASSLTTDIDGQKLTWTMSEDLPAGEKTYILIKTTIKPGMYGAIVNPVYLVTNGQTIDRFGKIQNATYLTKEEGKTSTGIEQEQLASEAYVNVFGIYGISSYKEVVDVQNTNNRGSSQQKAEYITMMPGGEYLYNLHVQTSSEAYGFEEITIIDRLPYIGDTGVIVTGAQRGTEWSPLLQEDTVTVKCGDVELDASQYVVEYSDAIRDMQGNTTTSLIFDTDDWANAGGDKWTTTWSQDAQAIRIRITDQNVNIIKDKELVVSFKMTVPNNAPANQIAWNSFGFSVTPSKISEGTKDDRFTAEPIKVGVKTAHTNIEFEKLFADGTKVKDFSNVRFVMEQVDSEGKLVDGGAKYIIGGSNVADADVTIDAAGKTASFEILPGKYQISESATGYVTKEIKVSKNGQELVISSEENNKVIVDLTNCDEHAQIKVSAVNGDILPTSVKLTGTKNLTGGKDLTAGMFKFTVEDSNGKIVSEGTNDDAAADSESGSITFEPIIYTEAGTHNYIVREVKETLPGIIYDNTIFGVSVEVKDNGQGALEATVTYPEKGIVFTNEYVVKPTDVALKGTKIAEGKELTDEQFNFAVYEDDTLVATGKNDADGVINFSAIPYEKADVHTYKVVETSQDGNGWTMDDTEYEVTVQVIDNGDGTLKTEVTYPEKDIVFTNKYDVKSTELTLTGTKIAEGKELTDEQFNFAVYEDDTLVATGKNDADGVIDFSAISYEKAGVHTYKVVETSLDGNGWTMDDTEYEVTVQVIDNGDGTLKTEVTYPEKGIVFNNKYTPTEVVEGQVTLKLSKALTDTKGNTIGTGKKFAVQILDSSQKLVERVILSANQDEVSISGLKGGETYYIAEETGKYKIEGYTIVGGKTVHATAIQIEMPTALEGESVEVKVIVNNSIEPEKVPSLPDKTPKPRPVNVPKTGDNTTIMLYAVLLIAAVSGLTALLISKRKKKHNKNGDK